MGYIFEFELDWLLFSMLVELKTRRNTSSPLMVKFVPCDRLSILTVSGEALLP